MKSITRYMYAGIGTIITARAVLAETILDDQYPIVDKLKNGDNKDPIVFIQTFVVGLLSFLGIIMVFMTLWGGWKILTSGSKDEGKEDGKKIILNAVIGMVVIFFAWTITSLVFSILTGNGKV